MGGLLTKCLLLAKSISGVWLKSLNCAREKNTWNLGKRRVLQGMRNIFFKVSTISPKQISLKQKSITFINVKTMNQNGLFPPNFTIKFKYSNIFN